MVALAAACAKASGEVQGGDLTDAGLQAVTPGELTATYDAGTYCGEGTTWSSLYRDIFGPTDRPGSCSFASYCHGDPDGTGAKKFKCFDMVGCREGMIEAELVDVSNASNPYEAGLFGIIRHRDPNDGQVHTAPMPREPGDYVFPDACIERMKGWIESGIPAD